MLEPAEVITGERLIQMLLNWIRFRQVCKMTIPHISHGWITLLLGLQPMGGSSCLLIDKVRGVEPVLAPAGDFKLLFELTGVDGVPYWFETRLIEYGPDLARAEVPETIQRMQRRRFFRVKARCGTEIILSVPPPREERAMVDDYSLGGVAFFVDPSTRLKIGDEIKGINLKVPEEEGQGSFRILRSVVRRIGRDSPRQGICAIEFLEMAEKTRDHLGRHVFQEERLSLRRTKIS